MPLQAWTAMNPGAALAAGLPLDPDTALDLREGVHLARRLASGVLEGAPSELDAMVARAVVAQAEGWAPYIALREVVECERALIYRGLGGSPEAERWDRVIGAKLPGLARAAKTGAVETLMARSLLDGIRLLARDAGFGESERAATEAIESDYATVQGDPSWDDLAHRTDLHPPLSPTAHRAILRDAYGFTEDIAALDAEMEADLLADAEAMTQLARRVGVRLPGAPERPEDVIATLDTARALPGDMLAEATTLTEMALDDLHEHLIVLDDACRKVRPEATPQAMKGLVTEGEEYLAGGLTDSPRAYCFITEAKCGSAYTLANVLYHELAHCWNMLRTSREARDLPATMRVAGTLGTALMEGIATLREWEVYELFREGHGQFSHIFGALGISHEVATEEFELDTRYWRVARIIRALFDFRVLSGEVAYGDFVREIASKTGLAPARVHGFCFAFFEKPGYAPCYAVGAKRLRQLQAELKGTVPLPELNARVSGMGMVPPVLWRGRVRKG